MANAKEIQGRIKSVNDTYKITNAMYMISSSKFQKAKKMKAEAEPYFFTLLRAIARIMYTNPELQSPFVENEEILSERTNGGKRKLRHCYIVVTADKGLAGAFNSNVIKETQELMNPEEDNSVFHIGELGRQYFERKGMEVLGDYPYTTANPSIHHARVLADEFLKLYESGKVDRFDVVFNCSTRHGAYEPRAIQLLPIPAEAEAFKTFYVPENDPLLTDNIEFLPNPETLLERIIPSYLTGFLYGTLVESYANEHSARMTAMDAANRSAQDMLRELSVLYNRVRQAAITQEITEVIGGAKKLKQTKQSK